MAWTPVTSGEREGEERKRAAVRRKERPQGGAAQMESASSDRALLGPLFSALCSDDLLVRHEGGTWR